MNTERLITCPECGGRNFTVKREVTYLYSYRINTDNIDKTSDEMDSVPFLFDNREKEKSNEYIECDNCGARFPVSNDTFGKGDMIILQKAIRSDHINNPEDFG